MSKEKDISNNLWIGYDLGRTLTNAEIKQLMENHSVLIDLGSSEGKFDTVCMGKKEFEIIQKKLKALEIIKKKRVDIDLFLTVLDDEVQTDKLSSYNFWARKGTLEPLSKEEFDLLKEVLQNE